MKMTNIMGSKEKKITRNTKQHVAETKTKANSSLCLDDRYPFITASCDLLVNHFNSFNLNYIDYFSSACTTSFFFFFKFTVSSRTNSIYLLLKDICDKVALKIAQLFIT